MEKKRTGLGTAALVLGIVGVVLAFIPIVNYVSYVLGVLALIFGLISLIKKSAKVRSIIAIALAAASITVAAVMQKTVADALVEGLDDLSSELSMMTGEATDDILENYLNVTIGEFTYKDEEIVPETKLEVKVRNISDEKSSFNVMIEAIDENGGRITEDYVLIDELGAGQEQTLEAFVLVDSATAKKLKTATFNIVEVSMY